LRKINLPHAAGLSGFDRGFHTFLAVHTLFLVFTRLPGVFINTMMMGAGDDITSVLLYNGAFFATGAACMVLAAFVLQRTNACVTAIMGIVLYFALYALIILLGAAAGRFHLLVGFVNGLADGFYWISYGQLLANTLAPKNRDRGLAVVNLFGSAVNLLIPLAAGAIIQAVGGLAGYATVFALASAVAALTCFCAARLPCVRPEQEARAPKTDYAAAMRLVRDRPVLRDALLGQGIKGVREGAFTFILSVVLYQIVRSELMIGVGTFLSGAAAIAAYWFMSRAIKPKNRVRFMLRAVLALCACAALGMLWIAPAMVLAYSVANALFAGFIENGGYTVFLDALTGEAGARCRHPELVALNECFLATGRCVGLGAILLVNHTLGATVFWNLFSLLAITLSQFGALCFSRRADLALKARADAALTAAQ
jgi:MFS family permease